MNFVDVGVELGDRLGRQGRFTQTLRPMYSSWLRAAYGRQGLPWQVNGDPIRIDPGVRHLVPRENEVQLFEFLRAHVRPGQTVLDIGAFLGTYAIVEARWVGETGRVLAFEPSPSSFALLQHHLKINGLEPPRVEARCAAVGARRECRVLLLDETEPYRNTIAPDVGTSVGIAVDMLTVDDICARLDRPPDWIRMDVQGFEFDVLRGAEQLLKDGRVRIVAEMHPGQWPEYGVDPREAFDVFASLGVRPQRLDVRCRRAHSGNARASCPGPMSSRSSILTAPSTRFRRRGYVEAAGEWCGNVLGRGSAREWLKRLYHRALMLQTGERGLRREFPGGEVVRVLPAYRQLGCNFDEYTAFRSVIRPGMLAFDVGANVGAYSLLLAEWVGPEGAVYAFEPAPILFEGLRQHVRLNRRDMVITTVGSAIGAYDGLADFVVANTAGESRLAGPHARSTETQQVPLVTIDSFCARTGVTPDFIKIDVEGWELAALRGARETIRRAGRRLLLFVELHPSSWPHLGITPGHVLAELNSLGLEMAPLIPGTDPWAVEGVAVRLRPR